MIIRLNNGKEFNVENSTNERCIVIKYTLDNINDILREFTNENLRYFAIIKDPKERYEEYVFHLNIQNINLNNGICTINLMYVDDTQKRITELEELIYDLYNLVLEDVFNKNMLNVNDDDLK